MSASREAWTGHGPTCAPTEDARAHVHMRTDTTTYSTPNHTGKNRNTDSQDTHNHLQANTDSQDIQTPPPPHKHTTSHFVSVGQLTLTIDQTRRKALITTLRHFQCWTLTTLSTVHRTQRIPNLAACSARGTISWTGSRASC